MFLKKILGLSFLVSTSFSSFALAGADLTKIEKVDQYIDSIRQKAEKCHKEVLESDSGKCEDESSMSYRGLPNLSGANFSDVQLPCGTSLKDFDLQGANLRHIYVDVGGKCFVSVQGAELVDADLRGADLRFFVGLNQANLKGARFDRFTKFPLGFDPDSADMVLIGKKKPEPSPDYKEKDKKMFAELESELALIQYSGNPKPVALLGYEQHSVSDELMAMLKDIESKPLRQVAVEQDHESGHSDAAK